MDKVYILSEVFPAAEGDESVRRGRVERLVINKEARTADIKAVFDRILPPAYIERYENEIRLAYKLSGVKIEPLFDIPEPCEDDILGFIDAEITRFHNSNPMWRAILSDYKANIRGEKVYITLRHGNRGILEDEKADEYLKNRLKNGLGVGIEVGFLEDEMEVEHKLEPIYERKTEPKEEKTESDIIYGKDFDLELEELMDISEINNDVQSVVIRGETFGKADDKGKTTGSEVHETKKGDKLIVSFYITDYTGSITVKMFVPKNKADSVCDFFAKPYKCVAVRGKVEYDTFSHELTVMARDIIRAKMPEEKDEAPVKRVELHAHSKSSAMDSVMEAKAYVKQAIKWGHKAVALTDHGVVQAFPDVFKAKTDDIKIIYGCEGYLIEDGEKYNRKETKRYHIIILAKNLTGLMNLYKLVSLSHVNYFYKRPLIPREELIKHREGLILGSACEAGELFRAIRDERPEEEIRKIGEFYDYFEIQPITNNRYLVREGLVKDDEALRDLNRRILALGDEMGKMTVATCDVHFLKARDEVYRRILQASQGFKDADLQPGLYFRTTDEMLEEFSYLGDRAYEVVVENTNKIADMVEDIAPVPKENYPPKIEGSETIIQEIAYRKAKELYGDPLPDFIQQRLEDEIESVVGHGYADLYNYARMLVKHSNEDGYIVGSRGSVGSSFLAYCAGITEVNSLPPHYRCPNCRHNEFYRNGEYFIGCDMPDKVCPECGTPYIKDGFDIPFETFLGFGGGKQPDIDLNFSGEYQPKAHKYTEEIFGEGYVFRAGTVSTVAQKTAFGYVKHYFEEREQYVHNAEIERLKNGCMGVKTTTGQHPGGVIILPKGHDIHEFTPVQYPANKTECGIITTHYDYHSIDQNLLKMDILGHDDPTMLKMLKDLTGVEPTDINIADEKVMSLFTGTEALGVTPEDIGSETGTFAVPEMGTNFVRKMLVDTKPKNVGNLVQISGLSHGTDVWTNNAQELIQAGICTISDVIGCRDDIMVYLIHKGLEPQRAFTIMEQVRKGKKLKPGDEVEMREHGVPEWYIGSCNKIQYMFPKAHAAAYVTMANRVAWYKVYKPIAFYQAYFTVRADTFDYEKMACGRERCLKAMEDIKALEKPSATEKATFTILEVVNEMYARGLEFTPIDIYKAHPSKFLNVDGKIMPAFNSIAGLGLAAAQSIEDARKDGPFLSVEDFKNRTSVSGAHIDTMRAIGCFDGMPESAQLSIFELAM
ncbi:MAG: PolC-type DNA polymerase III [Oscillospiraceae bacterium]|nr:PolC-type DNA polymerase III [Oscillospiraceae bacterium]